MTDIRAATSVGEYLAERTLVQSYRIEIHDPRRSAGSTPPRDALRLVMSERLPPEPKSGPQFRDTGEQLDVPLPQVPELIAVLLQRQQFEAARNLANAWFVGLAHLHGFTHVELGPVPSKYV